MLSSAAFLLFSSFLAATGQQLSSSYSKRLTEYLLANHSRKAVPDGLIHVDFEIELVRILEVNELNQNIKLLVYITESWRDPSLEWNPDDFKNLTETWLPEEDVWLPDIIVFNMISHDNLLQSVRAPVNIKSDGTVKYSHPAIYSVMCSIEINKFPVDDHFCPLEIASWDYGDSKLKLFAITSHLLQHYTPNEEWDLLDTSISSKGFEHEGVTVSEIFFNIHIQRKPLFYAISLVLPSYTISCITIFGLFTSFSSTGERQEKFSMGATAILTMSVLSLVVTEKVPASSQGVPLLVTYFLLQMMSIALATGTTGFIMWIHRKVETNRAPPTWLSKLFRIGRFKRHKIGTGTQISFRFKRRRPPPSAKLNLVENQETKKPEFPHLEELLYEIQRMRSELAEGREVETNSDWAELADRVDVVMMILFQTALAGILLYLAISSKFFV